MLNGITNGIFNLQVPTEKGMALEGMTILLVDYFLKFLRYGGQSFHS